MKVVYDVLGVSPITVPAGRFEDAVQVRISVDGSDAYRYYVPNVGLIRVDSRSIVDRKIRVVWELVRYTP